LFWLAWYEILAISRNKYDAGMILDLVKSFFSIEFFYCQFNELLARFVIEKQNSKKKNKKSRETT
jgi:hypothetical protein